MAAYTNKVNCEFLLHQDSQDGAVSREQADAIVPELFHGPRSRVNDR